MKVLSLFSGVGGFDMGLENAGMETVFQCEWDKHANSILHKHWPDVPKWDDVSTLTGKHILAHAPVIDVVAWGSPCQDLSVAGKRAGLEGGRSGLFHEGIRIIKELQEESNGKYPRISIWENVVGALGSNGGADFGVILDEMAKAGALVIECAVLDAQYFGVPQRRRRIYVTAIFCPVLASRCPNPLLPVAESLPGDTKKGKSKRQSASSKTSTSIGTEGAWWDGRDTAEALTTTSNENRMPDKQKFQAVVVGPLTTHMSSPRGTETSDSNHIVIECYTPSSFANYTEGVGTLRSNGGDLGGGSETLIAEPYVKSSRAQTSEDSETWILGEVNPTLNSFDVGDTRATTAIVEPMLIDGTRVNDVRVYEPPVQTLKERMGTGGNNVPMLAFDTQFGSNANVTEDVAPTLKASQQSPSVAYSIDTRNALAYDEYNDSINETHHALRAGTKQSTGVLISPTLTAYNMDSRSPQSEEQQRIVNAVFESTMAVRRLTPLECERLMGWPDDHTRYKADGNEQADTHRYKQCGNGVASPVAQWIAKHILAI
jgi:DNA (cytosine-5)-methyltransferase 1